MQSSSHIRITSAAKDGHGGTEIWLLRFHPRSGQVLFDPKTVQVYYADPEILLLRAHYQSTPLLICSAHAPHSGRSTEDIAVFWKRLQDLFCQYSRSGVHVIGGVDANAHFTYDCLPYIGSWGLERKGNEAADFFLQFLKETALFVPSTFEEFHEGETATWKSPANDACARCDYLLAPLSWRQGSLKTYAIPTLDSGIAGEDHMPLGGDFRVFLQTQFRKARQKGFDRQLVQKDTGGKLSSVFAEPPCIAWSVDVDVHADQLTKWVQGKLAEAYPVSGVRRKKSYISDTTWALRMERIGCRREQTIRRQWMATYTLQWAWDGWHPAQRWQCEGMSRRFWGPLFRFLADRKRCARLSRELSKALKQDRTAMLESLASRQGEMTQHDFIQQLKSIGVCSRKKPSAIKPLPIVGDKHGCPLLDYAEVAERWREHFGEQEAGEVVQIEKLFQQKPSLQMIRPTWEDLPTLPQIEFYFRATKRGKAFFVDGIPGDVLSGAPATLARAFYPLYLKQVVQLKEAVLYKGGRLVPAYKKGPPGDCASYRSLFVSSPIGKVLHAAYRPDLVHAFEERLPIQIGGMPGYATIQATMCLNLYHRYWIRQKHSVGILFVDIASAFYRLVREHFIQYGEHEHTLHRVFQKLRLPESAWMEFQQQMHEHPAIDRTDASPYVRALFKEFYCRTWFIVNDCPNLTQTHRGSRPGDSLADLCFAFALSKILQGFDQEVLQRFPHLNLQWDERQNPFAMADCRVSLSLVMPVWADDLALAIHAPTPEGLTEVVCQVSGMLFDRLASAGLQPNLKAGKTEVLIDYRGGGTLEARRDLLFRDNLIHTQSTHVTMPLRAVPAYKHLGTWLCVGAKAMLELRVRFGQAHSVITGFKTQIFGNKGMDLKTKVSFLSSLVFSAMHFNAAGWILNSQREKACLRKGHAKLLKRVALLHFGQAAMKWEETRVQTELGALRAEDFLREARLRFCLQLVNCGTPHLWTLIQMEQRWMDRLVDDFDWLRELTPEAELPRVTAETWEYIMSYIRESKGRWKALIRKAVKRHLASLERKHHWNRWHQEILSELMEQGVHFSGSQTNDLEQFCAKCKMRFASIAAQTVHAFKKHGRLCEVRHFILGKQCESCLRHYSTHVNLINHVKRKQTCKQFYLSRGQQVEVQAGVNSRGASAKLTEWHDPYLQAEGPQECRDQTAHSLVHPQQAEYDTLYDAWSKAADPDWADDNDILERLRLASAETVLLPKEVLEHYNRWVEDWVGRHEEVDLATLQRLACYKIQYCADWILDGVVHSSAVSEKAEEVFAREADSMDAIYRLATPLPDFEVHVVAHLFSGHRRAEDLQSILEQKGFKPLSIDIIFDKVKGNLLRQDTFQFFRRALYALYARNMV